MKVEIFYLGLDLTLNNLEDPISQFICFLWRTAASPADTDKHVKYAGPQPGPQFRRPPKKLRKIEEEENSGKARPSGGSIFSGSTRHGTRVFNM